MMSLGLILMSMTSLSLCMADLYELIRYISMAGMCGEASHAGKQDKFVCTVLKC